MQGLLREALFVPRHTRQASYLAANLITMPSTSPLTMLRRTLLPVVLILSLSACLTIEENYTFKKDGSGTMEYVVDMSAMAEMMESMEKMTEGSGEDDDGMGEMDMKAEAEKLKTVLGVSKVKVNTKEKFVQRVSFKFKDIASLNGALNVLMPDSSGVQHTFYTWEGNTLVRTNNRHATDLGSDMGQDAGTDSMDPTAFLQSMHYKFSFKFAQPITGRELAEGVVQESPNSKELKLDTDWSVIMKEPKTLDLRITLDR